MGSQCIECKKNPIQRIFYPDDLNRFCKQCVMQITSETMETREACKIKHWYDIRCQFCSEPVYSWHIKGCLICKYFYCINCRTTHVRDHIRKHNSKEILRNHLLDDIIDHVLDGYLL